MSVKKVIIPENFSVEEAAEFRQKLYVMIKEGERHFEINFEKCNFIDSTGLGVLVSTYKKCLELEGSFTICSVNNPKVLKVFKLTRLDKVFLL